MPSAPRGARRTVREWGGYINGARGVLWDQRTETYQAIAETASGIASVGFSGTPRRRHAAEIIDVINRGRAVSVMKRCARSQSWWRGLPKSAEFEAMTRRIRQSFARLRTIKWARSVVRRGLGGLAEESRAAHSACRDLIRACKPSSQARQDDLKTASAIYHSAAIPTPSSADARPWLSRRIETDRPRPRIRARRIT